MIDWISDHSGFVSAVTNLVMASIWAAYLQLFYVSVRRQRRPLIIISHAMGMGAEGHCLISNMSAAPIYVVCILAWPECGGRRTVIPVTDARDADGTVSTHQGPLASGAHMDLGSFEGMVRRTWSDEAPPGERSADDVSPPEPVRPGGDRRFDAIEIQVIATYASSRSFIGAHRRFERRRDGGPGLRAASLETHQISGFGAGRRLRRLQRDYV